MHSLILPRILALGLLLAGWTGLASSVDAEEPLAEEPAEEPPPAWEPEPLPWTRKFGRRRRE